MTSDKTSALLASRMDDIHPFYVMDILARAKALEQQGRDVVHLEVGEPDFTTPQLVKDAAHQAIENNNTFYTPATGLAELKQGISDYYQSRFSASVAAKNIVITPGASGALQLALGVLLEPGHSVLMADPGYPCNRHFVRMFEGKSKTIPVSEKQNYQLNHQLIDECWDEETRAVLIASPSNPSGSVISREEMTKIIDVVKQRKGVLLVDEIYQGLVYELSEFSAAGLSADIFVINSFSKFFAMTGWRLGWLVVPDDYLSAVDKLSQNIFLAPPSISQYAALAAFQASNLQQLDERREALKQRRDFLIKGLQDLGFDIPVSPAGAFYIYANIERFSNNSFEFCHELLQEAHVAITPGIDFGSYKANLHVRFAYTQNQQKLQLALDRISNFLSSYCSNKA